MDIIELERKIVINNLKNKEWEELNRMKNELDKIKLGYKMKLR